MVGVLRSDEQDDIDQKAECRELQNANKNELEDIEHSIEKLSHAMQRMENTKGSLLKDIASLASGMQKNRKGHLRTEGVPRNHKESVPKGSQRRCGGGFRDE